MMLNFTEVAQPGSQIQTGCRGQATARRGILWGSLRNESRDVDGKNIFVFPGIRKLNMVNGYVGSFSLGLLPTFFH